MRVLLRSLRRFNSNLVRLREVRPDQAIEKTTGFNSNLVRLRAGAIFAHIIAAAAFQFQSGAIKSRRLNGIVQEL